MGGGAEQLKMFVENILLVTSLALLAGAGLVLLLAVWIALRWRSRQREMRREAKVRRLLWGPTGRAPPMAPGLCDRCGRAHLQVYHLPQGRLCPECYHAQHPIAKPPR